MEASHEWTAERASTLVYQLRELLPLDPADLMDVSDHILTTGREDMFTWTRGLLQRVVCFYLNALHPRATTLWVDVALTGEPGYALTWKLWHERDMFSAERLVLTDDQIATVDALLNETIMPGPMASIMYARCEEVRAVREAQPPGMPEARPTLKLRAFEAPCIHDIDTLRDHLTGSTAPMTEILLRQHL